MLRLGERVFPLKKRTKSRGPCLEEVGATLLYHPSKALEGSCLWYLSQLQTRPTYPCLLRLELRV